ncbi:MAG TPA: DPP IV N-terminal domain-containing protein, partial [Terriglobia bacterium]|nr:DPP IV N-terminal domain-containing protein [Terriglobia bacterium]
PLILSQGGYRTTLYEWPEVSPDGSMIAFTKVDYGTTTPMSLWVMHADGSSPRWLTPDGVDDYYPTWSPDGSMVAFVRNNDLHIVNSDGTNVARVTWNHNSWYPSWTR